MCDLGDSNGAGDVVFLAGRTYEGARLISLTAPWQAHIRTEKQGKHRRRVEIVLYSTRHVPEYSRVNLTSKMVMTLPFRWLTSTSPSMLTILLILADTSPSLASILVKLSSNHCFAQAETSLLTQCQLLGLCRTMVAGERWDKKGKETVCQLERRGLEVMG